MPFSRKYQLETERKNNVVIKNLQQQGDLPEEAPWEHISPQLDYRYWKDFNAK